MTHFTKLTEYILFADYSTVTSSTTGKITSERSLSTAVAQTSMTVTEHSFSSGYNVIFEGNEKKDRYSTRGTMYSTHQRISLTSNKYYNMISPSTGIGTPSSSYAIRDSMNTASARIRKSRSDDLKTTRDYVLSTRTKSVSPSSTFNNWKTTKNAAITTTDSLQFTGHTTPFTMSTRIRFSSSYDLREGENTKTSSHPTDLHNLKSMGSISELTVHVSNSVSSSATGIISTFLFGSINYV